MIIIDCRTNEILLDTSLEEESTHEEPFVTLLEKMFGNVYSRLSKKRQRET